MLSYRFPIKPIRIILFFLFINPKLLLKTLIHLISLFLSNLTVIPELVSTYSLIQKHLKSIISLFPLCLNKLHKRSLSRIIYDINTNCCLFVKCFIINNNSFVIRMKSNTCCLDNNIIFSRKYQHNQQYS